MQVSLKRLQISLVILVSLCFSPLQVNKYIFFRMLQLLLFFELCDKHSIWKHHLKRFFLRVFICSVSVILLLIHKSILFFVFISFLLSFCHSLNFPFSELSVAPSWWPAFSLEKPQCPPLSLWLNSISHLPLWWLFRGGSVRSLAVGSSCPIRVNGGDGGCYLSSCVECKSKTTVGGLELENNIW